MTPERISHPPSRRSCAGASPCARFASPTRPCPSGGRRTRDRLRRREWLGLRHSCDQFLVSEPLADRGGEHAVEPVQRVVLHVAVAKPESELPDVAVQVLRRSVVIDPVQSALEQREHALDAVRGHIAAHVFASAVIDGFVPVEQPADATVDAAFVGVDRRADLNVAVGEADRVASGDAGPDLGLDARSRARVLL